LIGAGSAARLDADEMILISTAFDPANPAAILSSRR
jgi:hypothetical protein